MTDKLEHQPDTRSDLGGDAVPHPLPVSRAAELSTSKVLAGGMAAATSAVVGSHYGVLGTVGGAAVGSVVTTVGATIYQRSLEHARDRVARRMPHSAAPRQRTVAAVGRLPLRRVLRVSLIGTLLIFGLALGVVTGIEWAKGSPLSGGSGGTSLGHVFTPPAADARPIPPSPIPPRPVEPERAAPTTSAEPERSATPSLLPTAPKDRSQPPSVSITPSSPLPLPPIGSTRR
ncbi:MAG: hypothetical protein ACR2G2_03695 [Pseudonocardia sp.]